VLRHIYNFSYYSIQNDLGGFNMYSHMDVIVAAKKYLLPMLEAEALQGLEHEIKAIKDTWDDRYGATRILKVITLLSSHKDHNSSFEGKARSIAQEYVGEFLLLEGFRSFLDTDEGK
jgi:hypothetical protein